MCELIASARLIARLRPGSIAIRSKSAALDFAYTSEVLGPVQAAMREGSELPTINFSEEYLKRAGTLAKVRAAQAGQRLAEIWREGVKH